MSTLAVFLGPVSSAAHGDGDPWFTWIVMGVAAVVLCKVWMKYINRSPETKVAVQNLLWISGVCLALIILSVLQLVRT